MPLRLFRRRNFAVSNILGSCWSAGASAWFVITALYLQRVLGFDPLQVGPAYLPAEVVMAGFSGGLAAKMLAHFGSRGPLILGLLLAAGGLLLFATAPPEAKFIPSILPGMLLLGIGAGMAYTPLLLIALSDIESTDSGVASGIVSTSFMLGGALGLALLASAADARTSQLQTAGAENIAALIGGYRIAFLGAALLAIVAAAVAALLLPPASHASRPEVTPLTQN